MQPVGTNCMLFSMLEYAKCMCGRGLTDGFSRLVEFCKRIAERESAKVEGGYPWVMVKKPHVWAGGST